MRYFARLPLWMAVCGILVVGATIAYGLATQALNRPASIGLMSAGIGTFLAGGSGFWQVRRRISQLQGKQPVGEARFQTAPSGWTPEKVAHRWHLVAIGNTVAGALVVAAAIIYIQWPWLAIVIVFVVLGVADTWYLSRRFRAR